MVTTTVAKTEDATALARTLVRDRLAACVQIVPVGSVYRWNDGIEEAAEWMLVCKIRTSDYARVEAAILALHNYDTPEIVATPILEGFQPYLDWITTSTRR